MTLSGVIAGVLLLIALLLCIGLLYEVWKDRR